MNAAIHKFPVSDRGPSGVAIPHPSLETDTWDAPQVKELVGLLHHVISGSQALIDFVQADRARARRIGLEGISIEMVAVMEGEKFDRVVDAIREGQETSTAVTLTRDGFSRVKRLELLLAEASKTINHFRNGGVRQAQAAGESLDRAIGDSVPPDPAQAELGFTEGLAWANRQSSGDPRMSQKPPDSGSNGLLMGSMIVLGAIAITLIVYAATTDRTSADPQ